MAVSTAVVYDVVVVRVSSSGGAMVTIGTKNCGGCLGGSACAGMRTDGSSCEKKKYAR